MVHARGPDGAGTGNYGTARARDRQNGARTAPRRRPPGTSCRRLSADLDRHCHRDGSPGPGRQPGRGPGARAQGVRMSGGRGHDRRRAARSLARLLLGSTAALMLLLTACSPSATDGTTGDAAPSTPNGPTAGTLTQTATASPTPSAPATAPSDPFAEVDDLVLGRRGHGLRHDHAPEDRLLVASRSRLVRLPAGQGPRRSEHVGLRRPGPRSGRLLRDRH